MAEVTRVKKHGPPPRRTPRTFDVRLTEGEVDLLLALTGLAAGSGDSPAKYARRLHATLSRAAGYGVLNTDAFAHLESGSVVRFTPYRWAKRLTRARLR